MAKFPSYQREFKYTNELKQNTAYMLLGRPIGFDEKAKVPNIIGSVFAEEMYFWHSIGKEICVKENCPGGGIVDGFSIMDAVRTTDAAVCVVGIAASMGVSILLSARKEKRSAVSFAKAMIHPPAGKEKVYVDAMRGSLMEILTETTNYSKAQVEDMMKDGAPDVWLTAKEMKSKGLISEIIPVNIKEEVEESADPYTLFEVFNQINENTMATKPEERTLDESLKAFADLQNSLNEKTTAIASKEAEIVALTAKLKAFEDKEKTDKLTAATALVDVAVKNKQIVIPADNAGLKDQYIKMAQEAPEAFKAMLGTAKAPATERQSVLAHVKTEATAQHTTPENETYEWLANHNPTALYEMMDNEPEKYTSLVNAFQAKTKYKTSI